MMIQVLSLCITIKLLLILKKTAANPLYQLLLLVDISQVGDDLDTYPTNFTDNYIIAYGIIGTISDVDAGKTYDFHTAFDNV